MTKKAQPADYLTSGSPTWLATRWTFHTTPKSFCPSGFRGRQGGAVAVNQRYMTLPQDAWTVASTELSRHRGGMWRLSGGFVRSFAENFSGIARSRKRGRGQSFQPRSHHELPGSLSFTAFTPQAPRSQTRPTQSWRVSVDARASSGRRQWKASTLSGRPHSR